MDDVDRAIEKLQHSPDSNSRFIAVAKLGTSADPRAIPYLIMALSDADERVRTGAAGLIHRYPHPDVIEPLVRLVDDVSPRVRRNAITSLVRLHFGASFEMLLDVIRHDNDTSVRGIAVQLLGEVYDERVIGALAELLNDTTPIGYDTRTDTPFRVCDSAAKTLEEKIATPEALTLVKQWRRKG